MSRKTFIASICSAVMLLGITLISSDATAQSQTQAYRQARMSNNFQARLLKQKVDRFYQRGKILKDKTLSGSSQKAHQANQFLKKKVDKLGKDSLALQAKMKDKTLSGSSRKAEFAKQAIPRATDLAASQLIRLDALLKDKSPSGQAKAADFLQSLKSDPLLLVK